MLMMLARRASLQSLGRQLCLLYDSKDQLRERLLNRIQLMLMMLAHAGSLNPSTHARMLLRLLWMKFGQLMLMS